MKSEGPSSAGGTLTRRQGLVLLVPAALRAGLPEVAAFILAAVFYLYNAVRYALPTGYGGLFALMSEAIEQNGFRLPATLPYYGPGGMPFAYPPVGPYLAALILRSSHLSTLDYLRYQPAIGSLVFAAAFYAFARVVLRSRGKAIVAALLVTLAGEVYGNQATASGMVRSLAGIFMVGACALAVIAYRPSSRLGPMLAAGVFFGLTLATHLSYAVVGGLGILALALPLQEESYTWRRSLPIAAGILGIGVLITSPWWGAVLHRYGGVVFLNALASHGNTGLVAHLREGLAGVVKLAGSWLLNLGPRWSPLPLVGMILVGLGYGVARGRWSLVAWFAGILFLTGESDRYLAMVGALLAADLLLDVSRLSMAEESTAHRWAAWRWGLAGVLVLAVCYWQGFRVVRAGAPTISQEAISLGAWFSEQTPANSEYLLLTGEHDLAEWMPYLLRRTPTTAPWGSEWLGRYGIETYRFGRAGDCAEAQSFECVTSFLNDEGLHPNYLVVPRRLDMLAGEIEGDTSWISTYSNEGFWVFESRQSPPS